MDGGVTFDSCATNQSGECAVAIFASNGDYTIYDYGVKNNFKYAYLIRDYEGGGDWHMTTAFEGSLEKPPAPAPSTVPTLSIGDLWTNGNVATISLNISRTPWAHTYEVSYYDDHDPTVRIVTRTFNGYPTTIVLAQNPSPSIVPNQVYHIKTRGMGMGNNNTAYSTEQHVRVMRKPNLFHAEVVGGTAVSLQWTSVFPTAQYDIIYQNMSTDPPSAPLSVDAGMQRIWQLSSLSAQSTYLFQVRARDAWGHASQGSIPVLRQTGSSTTTDVTDVPGELELRAYPVPFRPNSDSATIAFAIPKAGSVELGIYDVRGRLVRLITRGNQLPGRHRMSWDGRNGNGQRVAAGIYVARLRAIDGIITRKLVVTR